MMFYAARCRRVGFTLIEIMIVIAIIAILAAIAIPNFVQSRAETQLAACRQNILAVVKAVEICRVRHSDIDIAMSCLGRIATLNTSYSFPYLLENGYLDHVPECPLGVKNTYGYTYNFLLYVSSGDVGSLGPSRIYCTSYHIAGGDKKVKPSYNIGKTSGRQTAGYRYKIGWDDNFVQSI